MPTSVNISVFTMEDFHYNLSITSFRPVLRCYQHRHNNYCKFYCERTIDRLVQLYDFFLKVDHGSFNNNMKVLKHVFTVDDVACRRSYVFNITSIRRGPTSDGRSGGFVGCRFILLLYFVGIFTVWNLI